MSLVIVSTGVGRFPICRSAAFHTRPRHAKLRCRRVERAFVLPIDWLIHQRANGRCDETAKDLARLISLLGRVGDGPPLQRQEIFTVLRQRLQKDLVAR